MSRTWHPVAASSDLVARHVFHGQLMDQEFAIWRGDDGGANIWENRCLHRGVRLSIGINNGSFLQCQYHGWRYENRTGGCSYIPAHPENAPLRNITVRQFPSVEKHGLVWTNLASIEDSTEIEAINASSYLVLRAIPVWAAASQVQAALAAEFAANEALYFVQPTTQHSCIIRGLVTPSPEADHRLMVARHYNQRLINLRNRIEAGL